MFEPNQKESIPEREERILTFWQRDKILEKSLEENKNKPIFSFYDGPPFATGLPHYGHLLTTKGSHGLMKITYFPRTHCPPLCCKPILR